MEDEKVYLKLHPSENAVLQASARVYSGYLAAGIVTDDTELELIVRSVDIALRMAGIIDQRVQCEDEVM